MQDYLHNHNDFKSLLDILEEETGIISGLIEKDYWIMHVLYGLKQQGYTFELKGGTSLSKGYHIIDRFSEDIDIHISPPEELKINENPNNDNSKNIAKRKLFYDQLAEEIKIDGIVLIERDIAFDNTRNYLSGGIRLFYKSLAPAVENLKEGILLEAGFDVVTPNVPCNISSWAYDKAISKLGNQFIDNRAIDIPCYHPGYTLVEKLQTIVTKFRMEQETTGIEKNFMRQYYDVANLLLDQNVIDFIGTEAYKNHKEKRFPLKDKAIPIAENEAFLLSDIKLKERYKTRYQMTKNLFYKGQPDFEEILGIIKKYLEKL
jgi:hypothetical protein